MFHILFRNDRTIYQLGRYTDPSYFEWGLATAGKHYFKDLSEGEKRRVLSHDLIINLAINDDEIVASTGSFNRHLIEKFSDPWIGLLIDMDGEKIVYGLNVLCEYGCFRN